MPESNTTDAREQSGTLSHKPIISSNSTLPEENSRLTKPFGRQEPQTSVAQVREPSSRTPRWLRPFFSLRVQLTSIYCLLLILMVGISILLTYRQMSSLSILFI